MSESDTPNLLFIWTDQQAADTMAAYGNERIETPNLNRLADRSTVFENAYCSQPICGPSRSTVMTGLYPHTTGYTENNLDLSSHLDCFPELGDFDDYSTAFIGKWHLGDEVFRQRGFDEWISTEDNYREFFSPGRDESAHSTYHDFLVENGFEPDVEGEDGYRRFSRQFCAELPEEYTKPAFMARETSRLIRENRDTPFILHVMFLEPHDPFTSSRNEQYDPDDVALPENFEHGNFDTQTLKARLMRTAIEEGVNTPEFLGKSPTEDDWRRLIANYWGLVSLVDTHVGRILDTLSDCGLDDETIVTFTSDHGEMMGSHRLLWKSIMFEEALKVPLLIRLPNGARNGESVSAPISQVDLVPTLLDAMGQPVPEHLHGRSRFPFLNGERGFVEENVFAEWNGCTIPGQGRAYAGTGDNPDPSRPLTRYMDVWDEMADEETVMTAMTEPVRTIVTPDGWKLNYRGSGAHELYDLENDPHEIENVAGDPEYDDLVGELARAIFDWQNRTNDPVYVY